MLKILAPTGFALILVFSMSSCSRDDKKLRAECDTPGGGEACNKIGLKLKGQEALNFFRVGCQKQSAESCLSLASRTPDPIEAKKVLKQACDQQNAAACAKIGEPLKSPEPRSVVEPVVGNPEPSQPATIATQSSNPVERAAVSPGSTSAKDEYYSESAGRVLKKKKGRFRKQSKK